MRFLSASLAPFYYAQVILSRYCIIATNTFLKYFIGTTKTFLVK